MADATTHGAAVDAWMLRRLSGLTPSSQVAAFEAAFEALWRRAGRTLGEVTLSAICERALLEAAARNPVLASLRLEAGRLRCDELRALATRASEPPLQAALRAVLVELLTILGNLTADILTPALHAELGRVASLDDEGPARGEARA